MIKILLAICTLSFINNSYSQNFKSELDFGGGTVFTTFLELNDDKDSLRIFSAKNADKRIMGNFKANVGRLFGKSPKQGVMLNITALRSKDSLIGISTMPVFGKLKFRGRLLKNSIEGKLYRDSLEVGTLTGFRSDDHRIEYIHLYPRILKIVQSNIYSRSLLKSFEWKKFQKKIKRLLSNASDDIELFLGFNILSSELSFSHMNLLINNTDLNELLNQEESDDLGKTSFEEVSINTAYFKISSFSSSKKEIEKYLSRIVQNENYKNLIIDLRDNSGGSLEPAFQFAKYIVKDEMEIGYFITNKFESIKFDKEQFQSLPVIKMNSTSNFFSSLKSKGSKLVFTPTDGKKFEGDLYILTNNNTASTCEPIVYSLKKNGKAVIIGQKTSGAMLASSYFEIDSKYLLKLPVADFYTFDGKRLEDIGVIPDIITSSDNALEKALEIIATKN